MGGKSCGLWKKVIYILYTNPSLFGLTFFVKQLSALAVSAAFAFQTTFLIN